MLHLLEAIDTDRISSMHIVAKRIDQSSFPCLEGNRVNLRTFSREDLSPEYIGWLNDKDTMRFSNQRFRTHTKASCEAYLESFSESHNYFLAIVRREDGRTIGTMTAYLAPLHLTADLGILIGDRSCWGKGLGCEAWSLLITWLLSDHGLRKVTAGTLESNVGMLRIMERSGMHLEATLAAQEILDGVEQDILCFAKFADGRSRR